MQRHIAIKGLIVSSILALTLAGCSGKTASPVQTQPDSQAASLETGSPAPGMEGTTALYIGVPD